MMIRLNTTPCCWSMLERPSLPWQPRLGDSFAPFFAGFLPLLVCKTKQGCTVAEKSFAVGTLAETIQGLGAASAQFVSRLLPVLLSTAREADPEVRSNAIFGLGVLAEHGGHPAQEHFPSCWGSFFPSWRGRDTIVSVTTSVGHLPAC